MFIGNVQEIVHFARRLAVFFPKGGVLDEKTNLVSQLLRSDPFTHQQISSHSPIYPLDSIPPEKESITHPYSIPMDNQCLDSSSNSVMQFDLNDEISLENLEQIYIQKLLKKHQNISLVARILEINRRTLQRKLKSWGMKEEER